MANNPVNAIDPYGLLAQLPGTPMNPAYWNMLADAGFYSGVLDKVQFGLDLLGLTEPFGFAADLLNAGISYGRGDALGGSLSLGAAIPGIGAAATVGKFGSKGADVLQANKAAGDAFERQVMEQLQQTPESVPPTFKSFITY